MAQTSKSEEKVRITLPISEEHQDDVWVCINGHGTLIQRGVEVEVSQDVYKVLKNTQDMEMLSVKRQKELKENLKEMK